MPTSYMKVKRNSSADEWYTPSDAVHLIEPYLPDNSVVWCPFDTKDSEFVKVLSENHKVIHTHIFDGQDFFQYEPSEPYDVIVSNPPFSRKDDVFERLFDLDKPFAMVMSMNNIFDSKRRYRLFRDNEFELLVPEGRIKFNKDKQGKLMVSPPFQSVFVCHELLDKQIVFVDKEK